MGLTNKLKYKSIQRWMMRLSVTKYQAKIFGKVKKNKNKKNEGNSKWKKNNRGWNHQKYYIIKIISYDINRN